MYFKIYIIHIIYIYIFLYVVETYSNTSLGRKGHLKHSGTQCVGKSVQILTCLFVASYGEAKCI